MFDTPFTLPLSEERIIYKCFCLRFTIARHDRIGGNRSERAGIARLDHIGGNRVDSMQCIVYESYVFRFLYIPAALFAQNLATPAVCLSVFQLV